MCIDVWLSCVVRGDFGLGLLYLSVNVSVDLMI